MQYLDFRSDTVTQPTEAMREAMFKAAVGDDVYGDDPTINELETLSAKLLGKQAAMFVPSGTMGNQVCLMTHVPRFGEVICGMDCHIMAHEAGAAAGLTGAFMRPLSYRNDITDVELIKRNIRDEDIHFPETALICVEQATSNGRVVPLEVLRGIKALADAHAIPVHMDGARLFNAAVALHVPAQKLAECADSVTFCLSKGLCAPVGSVVVGTADFIGKARKNRKRLGGGMRQAGFLAAAGILALTDSVNRLSEDHENAKYLALELQKLPGITADIAAVEINMVFFKVDRPEETLNALPEKLRERGILMNGQDGGMFRLVTNHGVGRADIDRIVSALRELLES